MCWLRNTYALPNSTVFFVWFFPYNKYINFEILITVLWYINKILHLPQNAMNSYFPEWINCENCFCWQYQIRGFSFLNTSTTSYELLQIAFFMLCVMFCTTYIVIMAIVKRSRRDTSHRVIRVASWQEWSKSVPISDHYYF